VVSPQPTLIDERGGPVILPAFEPASGSRSILAIQSLAAPAASCAAFRRAGGFAIVAGEVHRCAFVARSAHRGSIAPIPTTPTRG
jgi:hypothetical protein